MNRHRQLRWQLSAVCEGLLLLATCLAWLGLASPAGAYPPPEAPLLRIEPGTHTAAIRRMDVDAAERYLVTGSDDKTVRVWSLAEGRLLQVLRLPLGPGNEGKVYAVAISPDGDTIAAGGWTGFDWDGEDTIYLFERQSGRLIRRLGGLPNAITHLAYDPEGRTLVANLGRNNGIRVWRTQDYEQIAKDTNYDNGSYWADFDPAGRLVTSASDGYVRLYDADFRLITRTKPPGGTDPLGVAFSPDGSKIAVGFDDTSAVNVLSGQDLSLLYSPDTTGISGGDLSKVRWSRDGRQLFAGGTYDDGTGMSPILSWLEAGRGARRALPAGQNTVMGLYALADGRLLWTAADPAIGLLDTEGRPLYKLLPESADIRNQRDKFLVSMDGGQVQFGFEAGGKRPARFSLAERRLQTDVAPGFDEVKAVQHRLNELGYNPGPLDGQPGPRTREAIRAFQRDHGMPVADGEISRQLRQALGVVPLSPPRTRAPGVKVTDWINSTEPKLNGDPLPLEQWEMSRSLAIAPDGTHFLLGSGWSLRYYDRQGKTLWKIPIPGDAWAVNISGDGRLALAAFGDGTIRWYRLTDGEELLAFFPHNDGKRWVVWTPQGYYQASPGAEDLIGWHLNQGRDQTPEFYGASRFRDQFYRPDVIARVLQTRDVQLALKQADAVRGTQTRTRDVRELRPPIISVLSPPSGTPQSSKRLTVTYKARSKTGPILEVLIKLNGRPVAPLEHHQDFADQNQFVVGDITLDVPPEDAVISLIARNEHGSSEPARHVVNWSGDADWYKPKLYVLAVGISVYQDAAYSLNYAAKDARDFVEAIKAQEGGLYRRVSVRFLPDREARKGAILDGLEWLEKQTTPRDVAILFLSGHGRNDARGRYRFLPHDYDRLREKRTSISENEIRDFLGSVPGKVVALLDTCHSGGAAGAKGAQQPDVDRLANELADADHGVIVFSSSTGRQFSLEDASWGNGAFTKALVEGIRGQADYHKDWFISMAELEVYLGERVKQLTAGRQTPVTTKPEGIPDFKMLKVQR